MATRTQAEIGFHLGLAAILLPVVTLPIVWWLAIANLRAPSDQPAAQRRWARRLVGLAIIDTFVAAAVVLATLTGMSEALAPAPEPPRIGVLVDPPDPEAGVLVREVLEGSPAATAGVTAGDRILRAGGAPVEDAGSLAGALASGEPVVLAIDRGGRALELEVTPRADLPRPTVVRAETCAPPFAGGASSRSGWDLAPYAIFLLMVVVLAVIGHRRGVRQWTFWLPFFAVLLLASVVGSAGTWLGCALAGGDGLRASAAGLAIGEVALTSIAVLWFVLARRRIPEFHDERERWPVARTYSVAVLYALAWMPRVAILSIPLLFAARQLGVGEVSPMLESLLGPTADLWTAALVFVSAVVLAPIAEEVLFRGLLLPHLGRSLASFTAIYVGALLFGMLHVSHGVMLIGPLVLGALLGWARLRSRGLLAPILLHVTFNAFATISSWAS